MLDSQPWRGVSGGAGGRAGTGAYGSGGVVVDVDDAVEHEATDAAREQCGKVLAQDGAVGEAEVVEAGDVGVAAPSQLGGRAGGEVGQGVDQEDHVAGDARGAHVGEQVAGVGVAAAGGVAAEQAEGGRHGVAAGVEAADAAGLAPQGEAGEAVGGGGEAVGARAAVGDAARVEGEQVVVAAAGLVDEAAQAAAAGAEEVDARGAGPAGVDDDGVGEAGVRGRDEGGQADDGEADGAVVGGVGPVQRRGEDGALEVVVAGAEDEVARRRDGVPVEGVPVGGRGGAGGLGRAGGCGGAEDDEQRLGLHFGGRWRLHGARESRASIVFGELTAKLLLLTQTDRRHRRANCLDVPCSPSARLSASGSATSQGGSGRASRRC